MLPSYVIAGPAVIEREVRIHLLADVETDAGADGRVRALEYVSVKRHRRIGRGTRTSARLAYSSLSSDRLKYKPNESFSIA